MAKKSSGTSLLGTVLLLVSIVLGIAGILFLMGDGVVGTLSSSFVEGSESSAVTGYDFIFQGAGTSIEDAYPGVLTAFFLGIGGLVLTLVGLILKVIKVGKPSSFLAILGGLVTIVGGAMFFFSLSIAGINDVDVIVGQITYRLGWGLILSAICLCASGIVSVIGGMAGTLSK